MAQGGFISYALSTLGGAPRVAFAAKRHARVVLSLCSSWGMAHPPGQVLSRRSFGISGFDTARLSG